MTTIVIIIIAQFVVIAIIIVTNIIITIIISIDIVANLQEDFQVIDLIHLFIE